MDLYFNYNIVTWFISCDRDGIFSSAHCLKLKIVTLSQVVNIKVTSFFS